MNANKALWEKGDFTRIAAGLRETGAEFVRTIEVRPGLRVLDLGCGDGTTALPAAELGAEVLGVDIAANLVAAGRARAEAAGLRNLRFEEGDASHLDGLPDHSFDLVVSVFGAMFAPRPDDVAREMVRVTRPGGRIVMGNWIPGDPTLVAQVLKASADFAPPPPAGFVSPMLWGVEAEVVERFGRAGVRAEDVSVARDIWRIRLPGPPSALVDDFVGFYGPTMNAMEAAEAAGRGGELRTRLDRLFADQNAHGPDAPTDIQAAYLRVTVQVR